MLLQKASESIFPPGGRGGGWGKRELAKEAVPLGIR